MMAVSRRHAGAVLHAPSNASDALTMPPHADFIAPLREKSTASASSGQRVGAIERATLVVIVFREDAAVHAITQRGTAVEAGKGTHADSGTRVPPSRAADSDNGGTGDNASALLLHVVHTIEQGGVQYASAAVKSSGAELSDTWSDDATLSDADVTCKDVEKADGLGDGVLVALADGVEVVLNTTVVVLVLDSVATELAVPVLLLDDDRVAELVGDIVLVLVVVIVLVLVAVGERVAVNVGAAALAERVTLMFPGSGCWLFIKRSCHEYIGFSAGAKMQLTTASI